MNRMDPISLTANKNTYLVLFDRPPEQFPAHMKVRCVDGQRLDCFWLEQNETHYYLQFGDPVGGQFRWYALIDDWTVPTEPETVESEPA